MREVCSKLYGLSTDDTHIWIEQLMLLYNREAGKKLRDAGQGILRRQTASLPSCVPVLPFLGTAAAQYIPASSDDTYHSGLSTEFYCHATSPIRRYVDLVNQRILKGCIASSEYSIDALNIISKNQRKYARSTYFLENVASSGIANGIIIEIGNKIHVYIEQWRMIIKVKYVIVDYRMMSPDESREYNVAMGDEIKIKYAVQYNKRRWKDKIVFEII
jgi:exoribonuclease R